MSHTPSKYAPSHIGAKEAAKKGIAESADKLLHRPLRKHAWRYKTEKRKRTKSFKPAKLDEEALMTTAIDHCRAIIRGYVKSDADVFVPYLKAFFSARGVKCMAELAELDNHKGALQALLTHLNKFDAYKRDLVK